MGGDSLTTTTEREKVGWGDKCVVWTKLIRSTWRRVAVPEWQLSTWTTPLFPVSRGKFRMINCYVRPICWSGGDAALFVVPISCPYPRGAYLSWAGGDILFFQQTDLHLDLMLFLYFKQSTGGFSEGWKNVSRNARADGAHCVPVSLTG